MIISAVVGTSSDSGRIQVSGTNNDTGQDTIVNFDTTNDAISVVATNVSNFVHGTDTAMGTATGGVDNGTQGSFTTSTGLVNSSHEATLTIGTGDIALTFAGSTPTETQFESRLQYNLTGTSVADTITTGALNDVIRGGAGNDVMNGGAGSDTFVWTLGDQGTTATVNHAYNFSSVTAANNVANAFEFEVGSGNGGNFNNLNTLNPSSNANYVSGSSNEASDSNYSALVTDDTTYWTPPTPGNNNYQAMWFQFNVTENENSITQIAIDVQAGRPDSAVSTDLLDLGIWNDSINDWELLQTQTYASGTVGNFTLNLTSNLGNYVDSSGHLTLVLFNEDQSTSAGDGQINADHVAITISAPGTSATTVDTINGFTTGAGGDVLNLDALLPASVTGATVLSTLDDYIQFQKSGSDTIVHVDHDGGTTFAPTNDILLTGVDLTSNNTLTTQQILQNLLNAGNLVV